MKFILSLLSSIGMGVNSLILSPQSYIYKISKIVPQSKFSIIESTETKLVIQIKTNNETSFLEYKLNNKKIIDVKYIMGT